jgi:hypothetical protein
MDRNLVALNGIDADTGGYLFPGCRVADLAKMAQGTELNTRYLRAMRRRHGYDEDHLGVASFVDDADDLAQAGWGVVHPPDIDPRVLTALEPLLRRRAEQAGGRYRELVVEPNELASDFLWRHGMGPDPVDPRKVPYYLLIVGPPQSISFEFQYQLDVQYAVGRIDFDTVAEYAPYAEQVVAADDRPKRTLPVHLFGTRNPGDTPTALSSSRLVEPLAEELVDLVPDIEAGTDIGVGATKSRLGQLLVEGPPILFTATHGLGRRNSDDREIRGALVCQDWPGPLARSPGIDPQHYLAATDLAADRPLAPRVVFSFACYSAGMTYVGRLPQRLLMGGVLAFVGHIDRAWGYSFLWQGADPQITAIASTILSIHKGHRVGSAMEAMNSRWAAIAADLTIRLEKLRNDDKAVDDHLLAWLWTASNDARNYVVIGDPAVRAW